MHLVSVENVQPGDIIGRSIYDQSELLLAAGYKLDKMTIQKLLDRKQNYVYIMDGVADEIIPEEVISTTLRQTVNVSVENAIKEIQDNRSLKAIDPENVQDRLENDPKLKNLIEIQTFRSVADDLLDEVISNNVKLFSALPIRTESAQEYQHAVDVALLAILMGQALELLLNDLKSLATAALLHDVGKAVIKTEQTNGDPKAERQQEILLREHPTYSMLILRGSDPNSYKEQHTVQQHHERMDGKGYPLGLQGDNMATINLQKGEKQGNIFRHAMLLAVANYYDNLISGKQDGKIYSPEEAIVKIIKEAGYKWNSHAVHGLAKVVQLYPVGTRVRFVRSEHLDWSGRYGVVVQNSEDTPAQPIVILTHNALGKKIQPVKANCAYDRMARLELVL